MASTIIAAVTNIGRYNLTVSMLYGASFQLKYYSVGNQGHDPASGIALSPDLSLQELPGQFFGPNPLKSAQIIGVYCPRVTIFLDKGDAVGDISNFGIWAEVLWLNTSPPLSPADLGFLQSQLAVGDKFLFAIANTGKRAKTDSETLEVDVDILF